MRCLGTYGRRTDINDSTESTPHMKDPCFCIVGRSADWLTCDDVIVMIHGHMHVRVLILVQIGDRMMV